MHNSSCAPFDLDNAYKTGLQIDPSDKDGLLTNVGRALQKKLGRPNAAAWPQVGGAPAAWNEAGDTLLQDMLTDPNGTWAQGRGQINGKWADVWDLRSNGLGARFDMNGNFETFLD